MVAAIPLVFALTLLGVMVLVYTDKHYACLRYVLVKILGTENHFDGGLWFSAEATIVGAFISAIPGLMCGILAYTQTERLQKRRKVFEKIRDVFFEGKDITDRELIDELLVEVGYTID